MLQQKKIDYYFVEISSEKKTTKDADVPNLNTIISAMKKKLTQIDMHER